MEMRDPDSGDLQKEREVDEGILGFYISLLIVVVPRSSIILFLSANDLPFLSFG